jgi:hypothetical protein
MSEFIVHDFLMLRNLKSATVTEKGQGLATTSPELRLWGVQNEVPAIQSLAHELEHADVWRR